jgi:hypothetical protein
MGGIASSPVMVWPAPGGENWPAWYAAFMVAEQIGKDPPS